MSSECTLLSDYPLTRIARLGREVLDEHALQFALRYQKYVELVVRGFAAKELGVPGDLVPDEEYFKLATEVLVKSNADDTLHEFSFRGRVFLVAEFRFQQNRMAVHYTVNT